MAEDSKIWAVVPHLATWNVMCTNQIKSSVCFRLNCYPSITITIAILFLLLNPQDVFVEHTQIAVCTHPFKRGDEILKGMERTSFLGRIIWGWMLVRLVSCSASSCLFASASSLASSWGGSTWDESIFASFWDGSGLPCTLVRVATKSHGGMGIGGLYSGNVFLRKDKQAKSHRARPHIAR